MNTPQPGDQIRLLAMSDDPDPIPPGTTGTVIAVRQHGSWSQVDVKWDNLARGCLPTFRSMLADCGSRSTSVLLPHDQRAVSAETCRAAVDGHLHLAVRASFLTGELRSCW